MARNIAFSGIFHGVDHERAAANEEITQATQQVIVLNQLDMPMAFAPIVIGWGGECRAEFRISAALLARSDVRIDVAGELFEGDRESTPDSVDTAFRSFVVPRGGRPVPFEMHLYHDAAFGQGGDSATLMLNFVNSLVEEEEIDPVPPRLAPPDIIFQRVNNLAMGQPGDMR